VILQACGQAKLDAIPGTGPLWHANHATRYSIRKINWRQANLVKICLLRACCGYFRRSGTHIYPNFTSGMSNGVSTSVGIVSNIILSIALVLLNKRLIVEDKFQYMTVLSGLHFSSTFLISFLFIVFGAMKYKSVNNYWSVFRISLVSSFPFYHPIYPLLICLSRYSLFDCRDLFFR
jgi:hypothetical protein